jgi:hypothetical protein
MDNPHLHDSRIWQPENNTEVRNAPPADTQPVLVPPGTEYPGGPEHDVDEPAAQDTRPVMLTPGIILGNSEPRETDDMQPGEGPNDDNPLMPRRHTSPADQQADEDTPHASQPPADPPGKPPLPPTGGGDFGPPDENPDDRDGSNGDSANPHETEEVVPRFTPTELARIQEQGPLTQEDIRRASEFFDQDLCKTAREQSQYRDLREDFGKDRRPGAPERATYEAYELDYVVPGVIANETVWVDPRDPSNTWFTAILGEEAPNSTPEEPAYDIVSYEYYKDANGAVRRHPVDPMSAIDVPLDGEVPHDSIEDAHYQNWKESQAQASGFAAEAGIQDPFSAQEDPLVGVQELVFMSELRDASASTPVSSQELLEIAERRAEAPPENRPNHEQSLRGAAEMMDYGVTYLDEMGYGYNPYTMPVTQFFGTDKQLLSVGISGKLDYAESGNTPRFSIDVTEREGTNTTTSNLEYYVVNNELRCSYSVVTTDAERNVLASRQAQDLPCDVTESRKARNFLMAAAKHRRKR